MCSILQLCKNNQRILLLPSCQGAGLCPVGSLSRRSLSRGDSLPRGTAIQKCEGGTHPIGMHSCIRVFQKLSIVKECQYCQLYHCTMENELDQKQSATLQYNPLIPSDIYSYLLTSDGKNEERNCNYMEIQSCQ